MKTKKTLIKRPVTKTLVVNIRMSPEEKRGLESAAKAENRTLSNYIIVAGLERAKAAR